MLYIAKYCPCASKEKQNNEYWKAKLEAGSNAFNWEKKKKLEKGKV